MHSRSTILVFQYVEAAKFMYCVVLSELRNIVRRFGLHVFPLHCLKSVGVTARMTPSDDSLLFGHRGAVCLFLYYWQFPQILFPFCLSRYISKDSRHLASHAGQRNVQWNLTWPVSTRFPSSQKRLSAALAFGLALSPTAQVTELHNRLRWYIWRCVGNTRYSRSVFPKLFCSRAPCGFEK